MRTTTLRLVDADTARVDRYLRIEEWASQRYRNCNGSITTFVGTAIAGRAPAAGSCWRIPTRYSVIEDMAAQKYLYCTPRHPGETLATAYNPNQ